MKTTAIILSGGKGLRAGSEMPKQYVPVCGKPVLGYTLQAFQKSSVQRLIIVAAPEYIETCRQIASDCGCDKLAAVVAGGRERYDSVLQGLRYLCTEQKESVVLIHDGARPFIRPETIDRIIDETISCGAAIAAAPCTDTIKLLDEDNNIISTTNRKLTWAAQTPQAFYLEAITEAYEKICGTGKNPEGITDDAMVFQLAFPDRKVKAVLAGADNRKITTAQDLRLAEYLFTDI